MTDIPTSAYHDLPGISSTETTRGQQPMPAKASPSYVEDNCLKIFLHVLVSLFMLISFIRGIFDLWPDQHKMIIAAIAFFYCIMIHLLLIKRREEERQRELEARDEVGILMTVQWAPMLMLVATGIVLISLGITISIFRPDWQYLALVAFTASVSMVLTLLMLKLGEINSNNP